MTELKAGADDRFASSAMLAEKPDHKLRWPVPLIICAGVFAVYAALLTRTYYWDGVLCSLYIESVRHGAMPKIALFHPNHLLYAAFGYALYSLTIPARAITLLQFANAVFGALTVGVVSLFAKRLTGSTLAAVFAAILFAFGATWWKFATDADSYIISVLLITIAILLAAEDRSLLAIAACQVAAMLFHELAVFAYVPIAAAILLNRTNRRRARIWRLAVYVTATAAFTFAVYLVCHRYVHPGKPLLAWVLSFAPTAQMTHSVKQILASYPLSYAKLFLGGRFVFIWDYFSPVVALGLTLCAASLAAAIRLFSRKSEVTSSGSGHSGSCLPTPDSFLWAWVAPYAAFLLWFEPSNAFYKLFLWPPLVLLIAIWVSRKKRLLHGALALAVAIAAWNFSGFIYPHAHTNADPVLALAETMNIQMPRDATIYYAAFSPDDWYLDYFAPGRKWIPLPDSDPLKHATKPVCFETTALQIIRPQTSPTQTWELTGRHNVRVECFASR